MDVAPRHFSDQTDFGLPMAGLAALPVDGFRVWMAGGQNLSFLMTGCTIASLCLGIHLGRSREVFRKRQYKNKSDEQEKDRP